MPFQRRAGAIGNQGDAVLVAQAGHLGHVLGGMREHDRIRQHRRVRRFVAAVVLAHRVRHRQAIAEARLQGVETGGRHRTAQRFGRLGSVHGIYTIEEASAAILRPPSY
ncbi:Uncharacterised protein [Bordetella pertussis]|nr:Uncharacterised protein [Bordetella pertussis]